MKELLLTLLRHLIAISVGWLGVTFTPEQTMELSIALFAIIWALVEKVLKPLFYSKFGERQAGDSKSGETPTASVKS